MSSASIDPATTALLVMDHQRMLVQGYTADPAAHLALAAGVIAGARAAGLTIIYVKVAFRPGYPEVSDNNVMFCGVRAGKRFASGDPDAEIAAEIAPLESDVVVSKHRVSAFEGTDLAMVLRARRIDTLALFGIATSGVVLSTVRQAADMDYRLIVLGDLCADTDAELHGMLIDKLLPRQSTVMTSSAFLSRL